MLGPGFAVGVAGAGEFDPPDDDCSCAIAAVPSIKKTATGKALHFDQVSFMSLSCKSLFGFWVFVTLGKPQAPEKSCGGTTGRKGSFLALGKTFPPF
jgi:hypothetical protein